MYALEPVLVLQLHPGPPRQLLDETPTYQMEVRVNILEMTLQASQGRRDLQPCP